MASTNISDAGATGSAGFIFAPLANDTSPIDVDVVPISGISAVGGQGEVPSMSSLLSSSPAEEVIRLWRSVDQLWLLIMALLILCELGAT
eukprot:6997-Pyramimonas_sp.AAC.2